MIVVDKPKLITNENKDLIVVAIDSTPASGGTLKKGVYFNHKGKFHSLLSPLEKGLIGLINQNLPDGILTSSNFSDYVNALTNKTIPVDADYFIIWDSVSQTAQKISFEDLELAILASTSNTIAKSISNYSHTGNTSETKLYSILLPANTFAVGDIMRLAARFTKIGTSNTWRAKVRIGTSDDLSGATILTQGTTLAAASRYAAATKVGYFKATNSVEFYNNTGVSDEDVITSTPNTITTFDCTVNNYLVFSVELVSGSADTAIFSGFYLQKI